MAPSSAWNTCGSARARVATCSSASRVAYVVGKANEDLANRASARKWTFDNADAQGHGAAVPECDTRDSPELGRMFIYRRNPDQVLLRDLMDADGKIPGPSVAWMISRMLNLACFLEYKKVSHLALSPDFLLISRRTTRWRWSARRCSRQDFGKRPLAAPKRTLEVVPSIRARSSSLVRRSTSSSSGTLACTCSVTPRGTGCARS
jgi:hypothetical protein